MTKHKQLIYKMYRAYDYGVKDHPQVQMEKLGYKVLAAVAQSMGDCWWFTVEDYIEPLPEYLEKFEYDYDKWHKNRLIVT